MELRRRLGDRRPWRRDPWLAEAGSGCCAVLWGLIAIAIEFQLLRLSSMRILLELADERTWQAAGLMLGACQVWAVKSDRPMFRWVLAILAVTWWGLLFWATWMAAATPAIAAYFIFMAQNIVAAALVLPRRVAASTRRHER